MYAVELASSYRQVRSRLWGKPTVAVPPAPKPPAQTAFRFRTRPTRENFMGRVAARYYPEPQAIAEIVCEIARLPVEELMGDRRTQNRVRARFVVWTLIYDLICPKYEYVAAYSGKDHTSCHHGIKTLRARLATDVRLRNLYDAALLTIRRDLGEAPPRYQWSET